MFKGLEYFFLSCHVVSFWLMPTRCSIGCPSSGHLGNTVALEGDAVLLGLCPQFGAYGLVEPQFIDMVVVKAEHFGKAGEKAFPHKGIPHAHVVIDATALGHRFQCPREVANEFGAEVICRVANS